MSLYIEPRITAKVRTTDLSENRFEIYDVVQGFIDRNRRNVLPDPKVGWDIVMRDTIYGSTVGDST